MTYYLVQIKYGYTSKDLLGDWIWLILTDKELDRLIKLHSFEIQHRNRVFYIGLKSYVKLLEEESVCNLMSKDLNKGDLQPLILSKLK